MIREKGISRTAAKFKNDLDNCKKSILNTEFQNKLSLLTIG